MCTEKNIIITSCNNLSFRATTLFNPSFSNLSLSLASFKSSVCRVKLATVLWDILSWAFVFSSAFRAFTTPVCKSARTLVVPPGVRLNLLLGDGRVGTEDEFGDKSGESDLRRVGGRGDGLVIFPSSVRALALPVLKGKSVNFGSSNGVGHDHYSY